MISMSERFKIYELLRKVNLIKLKQTQSNKEVKECTFQPKINRM